MAKSLPDSLGGAGLGPLESHYFKIGLWTRASSGWESPRCQDPGLSVAAIDARMQHLVAG
ncbi:hypothetical protein ACCO45_013605 [Purpureocillium lilacinum]|uniref:Uncharacterized protein n=1 Tax=Purpureocillium lilacinum TaxID=33203 RepID=A0ACC4D7E7_PURLI